MPSSIHSQINQLKRQMDRQSPKKGLGVIFVPRNPYRELAVENPSREDKRKLQILCDQLSSKQQRRIEKQQSGYTRTCIFRINCGGNDRVVNFKTNTVTAADGAVVSLDSFIDSYQ